MPTYLSIGTDQLFSELFQPIKNTKDKPTGGLWATHYDLNNPQYNIWAEYLLTHPYILYYKNNLNFPKGIPAVVINLKKNVNLFTINSKSKLDFLKQKYPTDDNWIDFEKLSADYDGIFINVDTLLLDKNIEDKTKLTKFSVDSLILFNLKCIENYYSAYIDFNLFDYYLERELANYNIYINTESNKIPDSLPQIEDIIMNIKKQISDNTEKNIVEKYDEILTKFIFDFKMQNHCLIPTDNLKSLLIRRISRSI